MGKGVTEEVFRKEAKISYIAQNNLGYCYYYGRANEQNNQKALKWWRRAAGQGYGNAENALGVAYFTGLVVNKNYEVAGEWFKKAACSFSSASVTDFSYKFPYRERISEVCFSKISRRFSRFFSLLSDSDLISSTVWLVF